LTYSEWLTDISGHPSATGRAQDSESTSAKDQCSTAGPRNQHGQRTGDIGHKPRSKLPLLSARPAVTFPASQRHHLWLMRPGIQIVSSR